MNKGLLAFFAFLFTAFFSSGQQQLVTYAGNGGMESFNDVMQLSDGSFIVCGSAENLDWIALNVPRIQLPDGGIHNAQGTNVFGYLLHLSNNLQEILQVVHFPQGAVEDIRFIKTTSMPGTATGDLFISGNTSDSYDNDGGYFLARLNNNFINGIPDGFVWTRNVWAMNYAKTNQPWDVSAQGELYYISGESHGYNWSAIYKLDGLGNRMIVDNWRTHWLVGGGEWHGFPASSYPNGGSSAISYSGIALKIWGRCELRSWTQEDFDAIVPDGNGGTKKGSWPADVLFSTPCDPENPTADGPGYSGYSAEACCPVWGGESIAVDRRNGHLYIGMNMKSYFNPSNTPDFEPAVIAMDETGLLKWWSRLYHEITPAGDTVGSIPDQYVDGLAIDYSSPYETGLLVVGARAHGNNVENLWEGSQIAANPNAWGFQNQFTGSFGNIHESWIGKLTLTDGVLMHSTYMGELFEGTGGLGTPYPDPNLDGWPDPNTGWPDLNTTYLGKNTLKSTADGSVVVLGVGRRTITTANAFQKMVLPYYGGLSAWNDFVRLYTPDLRKPLYSSLLTGAWDTLTQQGAANVDLLGVWKVDSGLVVVGRHIGSGNEMPTFNIPPWGNSSFNGQSSVLAYLKADNIINSDDEASDTASIVQINEQAILSIYPNPAKQDVFVQLPFIDSSGLLQVYSAMGLLVAELRPLKSSVDILCSDWGAGMYFLRYSDGRRIATGKVLVD